jgi:hypothetical protein
MNEIIFLLFATVAIGISLLNHWARIAADRENPPSAEEFAREKRDQQRYIDGGGRDDRSATTRIFNRIQEIHEIP